MRKILPLIAILFTLNSCSLFHIHKMEIEQGNIITDDTINKLHLGMTQAEVKELMGTPVLLNTFKDNRADYVYTFKPGYGNMNEKYITLLFRNGRLSEIKKAFSDPR